MENMKKQKYILWGLAAAGLSMLAVAVCFFALGVYPFGDKSVMTNDCYIQYVDYFRYLKEVISGNAQIGYSFSKSLGGPLVALFGYYLSSPFNVLLFLFPVDQMEAFIFVITVLKVGLCGFTFSLFIQNRLKKLKPVFVIAVSLAYAFTQYNVGQLSNISWLDGVYMLPLILWGIWRYVSEKKKGMLYLSIGLSILFNWYTGYMNCLFAVIYFLYEQIRWNYEHHQFTLKKTVGQFFRFCLVELLGVMLSCAFFIPVVLGQSSGRSILDEGIFDFGTNGSFLDIFRGFMIGTPNMGLPVSDATITLFCGVLTLIFCIAYFIQKRVKPFHKVCAAVLIGVMVLSQFIMPLEHIWCGFKFANAFQFRFAYITIFTVIFVGAQAMEMFEDFEWKCMAKICGACIGIFLVFDVIRPYNSTVLWIQTGLLVFYGLAVWAYKNKANLKKLSLVAVGLVFYAEILANSYWVASDAYTKPAGEYTAYSMEQEKLVSDIKNYDSAAFYRIEQNENRDRKHHDSSFFANESLAYGYSGIQQYSSSYDKKTADFIAALGYCKGYFPSFYNQPVLPADSLLGVKYLMSTQAYNGFEKISEIEGRNGKDVYQNPYALPLGFAVSDAAVEQIGLESQFDINSIEANNPFEFQNKVYSGILGEEIRIYEPVEALYTYDEVMETAGYSIEAMDEDSMIYGYTRSLLDSIPMYIDREFSCYYRNGWGNMGIYQVGRGSQSHQIDFETAGIGEEIKAAYVSEKREADIGYVNAGEAQPWMDSVFYRLNMDVFENAIQRIRENIFQTETFSDGFVTGSYRASEDGWLMLTIPNEDGWEISVNGETVTAEDGVNLFMTIPVKAGENYVELTYHPKGVRAGIVLSVMSVIIFAGWILLERGKDKNR